MIPEFKEAVAHFQRFLASQNRPTTVQWVFRDDLLAFRGSLNLRTRVPNDQSAEAARVFEVGRQRGLGVSLEALASDEQRTYAFVFVPEDQTDAAYRLMCGNHIKVAAPVERRSSLQHAGRIRWALLNLRRKLSGRPSYELVLPLLPPARPNSS